VQQLRDKVAAPLPAVIASAESLVPEAAVPTPPPGESVIKPTPPQTMASASLVTEISRPRSYWVQVAAFKSFEAAMRLASHLRREKSVAPDRWAVVMEPGPALARVRVGPFADRAEATANLRELASRGFKPFIAEESGDPR
jgi:cell division septation protein DedD